MSNAAVRVRTTSSARRKPVPLLFDIVEERLDATDRRALYSEAKSLFRAGQEHAKRKEGISSSLEFFRQSYSIFANELGMSDKAKKCLYEMALGLAALGLGEARAGRHADAVTLFEKAKGLFSYIGQTSREAMCYFQLGLVLQAMRDLTSAANALKEAVKLFGSIPDEPQEAMALCELASLFSSTDPKAAIFYFKQALIIFCSLGESHKEALTLFTIGTLSCGLRDYPTAVAYFTQARVIFHAKGSAKEEADAAYQLGKLASKAGQLPEAVTLFEEASSLYRAADQPSLEDQGWCFYRLALAMVKCGRRTAHDQGSTSTAIDYLSEALILFRLALDDEGTSSCLLRLGELQRDTDPDVARAHFEEALLYTRAKNNADGDTMTTEAQDRKTRRLTRDLAALSVSSATSSPATPSTSATTSPSIGMEGHTNSPTARSARAWWS